MQLFPFLILFASVLQKYVTGINLSDYLRQALPSGEGSSTSVNLTETAAEILRSNSSWDALPRHDEESREGVSPEILLNGTSPESRDTSDVTEIDGVSSSTTNSAPEANSSISANESQSLGPSSVLSNFTSHEGTTNPTVYANSTSNVLLGNVSSTETGDEDEGVVRGKPTTAAAVNATTTSKPETIYAKTLALISDTYTLSILVPVAAGVVFASSVILTLALCRCLRWKCRQRRLRRKALPGSVKNLSRSDSARLLAESSDEEF